MALILTIDPALSNTAFVISEVEGQQLTIKQTFLVQTAPNKKLPVMRDRYNRMTKQFNMLNTVLANCKPDLIVFEYPSGSQSSAAAVGIGYSLALSASIKSRDYKIEGVKPSELKKQVNGTNSADKKEIIAYIDKRYPNVLPIKNKKGDINQGKAEHIADAIVIAEVAIKKGWI
jgi:Holliday junction resolvasome RuvABC endonuclease subunit